MENDSANFKVEFEKRLVRFSLGVIELCRELRSDPTLWSITDQLIRASTSIGANVFEAKAGSSKRDYLKYFIISLKSANETKYWLLLLSSSTTGFTERIGALQDEVGQIANIIGAGVLTMQGKRRL